MSPTVLRSATVALDSSTTGARSKNLNVAAERRGLLSEEVDPCSGAVIGNFPQAFSHSGLINAAWAIAQGPDAGKRI